MINVSITARIIHAANYSGNILDIAGFLDVYLNACIISFVYDLIFFVFVLFAVSYYI